MTKLTRKSNRKPSPLKPLPRVRRRIPAVAEGCWLDIYEGPWFSGQVRRLKGPARFNPSRASHAIPGSIIVGPNARVAQPDSQHPAALHPRQIVPEFAKQPFARNFKGFNLLSATSTPLAHPK